MVRKAFLNKSIFKDFSDYWHYARNLSTRQRRLISENLSHIDQKKLKESYSKGGWDEVLFRDSVCETLEKIKEQYSYDIIEIRCKVLAGKSVYVPKKYWDVLQNELITFPEKHVLFAVGDIKGVECKENKEVVLILPKNKEI